MRRLAAVGTAALFLALPVAAQAYSPNDPLLPRQWYASQDHAFDAFSVLPELAPVRVAVIDTGIDLSHPELAGRIAATKSFVGGSVNDTQGHGTFVAGESAAAIDNSRGIAGLAPSAKLLIAKVVNPDWSVDPKAEAQAIRWSVRHGARVINLSLGGIRDPQDPKHSGFSPVEQRAIDFATSRGVLVVAAVGNSTWAPIQPWSYASYPSALPHVLGVGSYGKDGDVSPFSNRDPIYVDLIAPGEDMLSLFPRELTAKNSACDEQGYSSCGPRPYRHASGTSFSAPQATAAAAVLFGLRPLLQPDQVSTLLERSATTAGPDNGCLQCSGPRDSLSGWGKLDVGAAVKALRAGHVPVPDRFEPNDDIRSGTRIRSKHAHFRATIDWWDDPYDVYRIHLRAGQSVSVTAAPRLAADISLMLWKPELRALADADDSLRAKRSVHPRGDTEHIHYRATAPGWYSLEVVLASSGSGSYRIRITKS
ncbi:MAG: S8 family serine peptidase [Gaiellaceae bacterium]